MDKIPLLFFLFSSSFNALTSLALIPFVAISKFKTGSVRLFFIFLLAVVEWSIFYTLWLSAKDPKIAEMYARICMIGVLLMPPIFFHFVVKLIDKKVRTFWILSNYVLSLFFIASVFSDIYIKGMRTIMSIGLWPIPGLIFPFTILHFVVVYLIAHVFMWRFIKNNRGIRQTQIKYVFIGTFVGGIAGASNFISWYTPIPPIFNVFTSVYVTAIAYAITRYRFMDIEFIIRKGLLYSALTAIISAVYFSLIYISDFFFKTLTGYNFLWVTIPSLFVLAIFFQPLKNYLQQRIDKTFFKTKYEADKIRVKFSDGINKLMKIDDLAEYINRTAYKVFKLSGSAAYIFDEEQRKYVCRDARGTMAAQKGNSIGESDPLIIEIKKSEKVILRDEQKAMMQQGGKAAAPVLYEEMKGLNARICVPSLSGKKDYRLIAFLIADEKKSQDQFTTEDVMLLETFANQAVLNIENAVLYQAMIEARKRKLQVERLSELGSAASSVAKEARAALAPIIEFSHQFKHRYGDPDFISGAQEYLPFEVERLRLILIGILEFSRESKYGSDRINLKKMVNSMMDLIKYEARNKKINLNDHVDESIEISADKDRIRHVLLNLLINAMDAMPYGGKIWASGGIEEGKAVIKVSDTGTGITSDVMQKMFDPFFTTKKNAIGLGLAIVKKVIEGHGGSVEVYSEVGKGTTFVLKLPQVSP